MTVTVQILDADAVFRLLTGVAKQAHRDANSGRADAVEFLTEWQSFGDEDAERPDFKRLGKRAKWR